MQPMGLDHGPAAEMHQAMLASHYGCTSSSVSIRAASTRLMVVFLGHPSFDLRHIVARWRVLHQRTSRHQLLRLRVVGVQPIPTGQGW